MPVDHSIYFQQEAFDPFGAISRGLESGMKMSDMIRQRRAEEKKLADQQSLSEAYNSSLSPDGSLNGTLFMSQLASRKVDPMTIMSIGERFAQQKRLNEHDQIKMLGERDAQDISAAGKGIRIERDPVTGRVKGITKDPLLTPAMTPLQEAQMNYYTAQNKALGVKSSDEIRKLIADRAKDGFKPVVDQAGQVTGWEMEPWKKAQVDAETAVKLAQANASNAKAKKGTGGPGRGKMLPAGMAAEFGSSRAAMAALSDINGLVSANSDFFNTDQGAMSKGRNVLDSAQAYLGFGERGEKANSIDANLGAKAQIIGKYLEGGKLAEGDIKRYLKMLPVRGDTPGVVRSKVETLQQLIEQKINSELSTLQSAGYDTSSIARPAQQGGPQLLKGKSQSSPQSLSREQKIKLLQQLDGAK